MGDIIADVNQYVHVMSESLISKVGHPYMKPVTMATSGLSRNWCGLVQMLIAQDMKASLPCMML